MMDNFHLSQHIGLSRVVGSMLSNIVVNIHNLNLHSNLIIAVLF